MKQHLSSQRATIIIAFASTLICGCGNSAPPLQSTTGQPTAYICTETKNVFAADTVTLPATNPTTGRKTLVPALYCSRCNKWHPTPPVEILQRTPGAGLCPEHKKPMKLTGPIP